MEHPDLRIGFLGFSKNRIESLTDAIFAFAMTLLVLGVGYPTVLKAGASATVREILINSCPSIIHYALAFWVLAIFWMNHHMQSHYIKYIDRNFLWINILALMFVALIPFSTSLAGDFPSDSLGAIAFETNLLITGLLIYWQWEYATRNHRLVDKNLATPIITFGKEITSVIPIISVVGIVLGLLNVPYSAGVYLLVPLIFGLRIVKYSKI